MRHDPALDLEARDAAPTYGAGATAWVMAPDGVRLRAMHWPAEGARGTVLLFQGRTEYGEKYDRVAADLVAAGVHVVTVDWRGQGLSARLRTVRSLGHVRRFVDYQQDVAAMVSHAEALRLPRPWHLLAHSMGGAIGLRSLIDGLDVVTGSFSAPMWGLMMARGLRPVAWTVSSVSRQLGLGHLLAPGQQARTYVLRSDFAENTLTSDLEHWDWMRGHVTAAPDLALGGPSLIWLNESLREVRRLAALRAPDIPALALIGTDEAIVDPDAVRRRMSAWPGSRLVELPGARHEVLMESPTIRGRAMEAILERIG